MCFKRFGTRRALNIAREALMALKLYNGRSLYDPLPLLSGKACTGDLLALRPRKGDLWLTSMGGSLARGAAAAGSCSRREIARARICAHGFCTERGELRLFAAISRCYVTKSRTRSWCTLSCASAGRRRVGTTTIPTLECATPAVPALCLALLASSITIGPGILKSGSPVTGGGTRRLSRCRAKNRDNSAHSAVDNRKPAQRNDNRAYP